MGFVFKLIGSLMALAAASLLAFESARRGAIIFGTFLGLIKVLIIGVFALLLIFILYILLTPDLPRAEKESD
jgi:hypothetical protein